MTLDELRSAVPSTLTPGDDGWDEARLFHSGVGEPHAIVRPESVEEVQAAVRWAAASGIPVAVRGGGHSAWGTVPGGLTIGLQRLSAVDVDGTLVRVGGGAIWGDVARELSARGLGISSGDTASVGVGGLTLGGGIGWMVRAWGLAADQLEGAQLVTAEGTVIEVTRTSPPDLLWALRGGGGNFGVVTRFDFRAHELPGVVFATLRIDGDARPALRTMRDAMVAAPRALTVTYMDIPAMDPHVPAGATITACSIGRDIVAARAALGPMLNAPGISETDLRARDYPDILLESPEYDPEHPMPGFIGGNTFFESLTNDVIDRLTAFRAARSSSVLLFRSLGGAYGDVAPDATAFAPRSATWFAMAGVFDMPGMLDTERVEARNAWDAIEQFGVGAYGNFTTSLDAAWVRRMYPPATLARLIEVKRAWDPKNLFSRNHNVVPR